MTAIWTLLLLSIGVAMDAMAVSASAGVTLRESRLREAFRLAITFGVFQSMMAFLGWIAGAELVEHIAAWDHWVAFALLAIIGGKMIYESGREEERRERVVGLAALLLLGVATSIDALAVGITLPMLQLPLALSVSSLGVVTFVLSLVAALSAGRLGTALGGKLEIVGGAVLIGIGVKILVEHLAEGKL